MLGCHQVVFILNLLDSMRKAPVARDESFSGSQLVGRLDQLDLSWQISIGRRHHHQSRHDRIDAAVL